jgi:signal transduction histidine kinase/ligand-binding sensor domain-containing protein
LRKTWRSLRFRLVLFCLFAFCVLPIAFSSAQNETPSPQTQPSPVPSPSPSPTPTANLHQWGAVTLFHGLPSDRVHAIAQTADGVMWFATDGGLAKYDGRRTQAITSDGLPQGRVLSLKLDDDGALWIGTDSGAARLANGKFDLVKETEGKVITAIITPQRNRAIMATENGVVFDCQVKQAGSQPANEAEKTASVTFAVRSIPTQPLQSADKDQPGLLKITGLAFIHDTLYAGTQSRGLITIENDEVKEIQSKPRSFFINALETDAHGRLWVGARGRPEESALFDQSDPLKPAKANAPTGPVTAITRGAGEDIWVATDGRGAFRLENGKPQERFSFQGTGGALRSDHVFAIFVDREQVVWFGTDKGVCRYDPNAMQAENVSADPGANYVRALLRTSHGRLLAGTNSGLFAYDAAKSWRAVPELGRRIIYAISEDTAGHVLIASAGGLFISTNDLAFTRLSPSTDKLPQGDSVRAIANVGGATYIATYGYGVEKLQGSQRSLVWPDAAADSRLREVTTLGKDSNERLLIGTASAGLVFFDGKTANGENALDKLKGEAIWSVVADGSALWIATGKGLFLFQSGQLKEVVAGVNARQVVAGADNDHGKQIWCATVGNGIFKATLDDQFGAIVSRMDIEQGLPSQRAFAVLPERRNEGGESVIIATSRGIARYGAGRVPPTLAPERIISKRIHSADELRAGLQLDYPQNSLLIDVTANSSRTFPEQFQYAFALYDPAGHAIKQRLSHDAQFPIEGLKPGKYKVVVRAFTKDLIPSDSLSFQFSVAGAPFPWTSTALAVLLILALIALGWGYFQNRRIHRTSAELAAANRDLANARLQLANETEAERRRIARDLHDQTLADLRNLALLVDQLPAGSGQSVRPNRAPSAPTALRSEIESISQEVRRICEDLSPSALENVGLSAALQFALAHAVEHAAPDCKFDYEFVCDDALDEKLNLPSSVQIQIYRIAQEALSNICRHANAKHVKMTATLSAGVFELAIEDDGRGFDRSEMKKKPGRGVANIRARASMIDADVDWSKRDGGGTVFVLSKNGAGASPPS